MANAALKEALQRRLFSIGSTAEELGVHPDTLRNAAQDGRIPSPRRLGGDAFYTAKDVEALKRRLAAALAADRRPRGRPPKF